MLFAGEKKLNREISQTFAYDFRWQKPCSHRLPATCRRSRLRIFRTLPTGRTSKGLGDQLCTRTDLIFGNSETYFWPFASAHSRAAAPAPPRPAGATAGSALTFPENEDRFSDADRGEAKDSWASLCAVNGSGRAHEPGADGQPPTALLPGQLCCQ